MKIKQITSYLETFAPLSYQESYDNAGLLVGNANNDINAVVLCVDVTEKILEEAIEKKAGLIISHHPVIFSGLKRLTGRNYTERIVEKAIKNDIAIYAAHTNIDKVVHGVSYKLSRKLGLENISVLDPSADNLCKLVVYVPVNYEHKVREAIFETGAGNIGNYSNCSYNLMGEGSYKALDNAKPFAGEKNKLHIEKETRIEVLLPVHIKQKVIQEIYRTHPYEEPAFDIFPVENLDPAKGLGVLGELKIPQEELKFLNKIKNTLKAKQIKYTNLLKKPVSKVAICGGTGSSLLKNAIKADADFFISADFKYHEFFNADNRIVIVDVGHYESEQYTSELFYDLLKEKFPTFAFHLTKINSNPVNYL